MLTIVAAGIEFHHPPRWMFWTKKMRPKYWYTDGIDRYYVIRRDWIDIIQHCLGDVNIPPPPDAKKVGFV